MKLSVVIEWENAVFADCDRTRVMLDRLYTQAGELRRAGDASSDDPVQRYYAAFTEPIEAMVMHDPELIPRETVEALLWSMAPREHADVSMSVVSVPGKRYYRLKNEGASRSSGDLVLFLDSDVIPSEDWLLRLVGDMADEGVHVVAGAVFCEHRNFFEKAVSAFWVFPMPPRTRELRREVVLYANNVLFRREIIEAFPYPADDHESRGACARLYWKLTNQGYGLYRDNAARVLHPAPPGLVMLLRRGVAEGRDGCIYDTVKGVPARLVRALGRPVRKVGRATYRAVRFGRDIDLPWWQVPGVVAMSAVYFTAFMAGGLLAPFAPRLVDKVAAL